MESLKAQEVASSESHSGPHCKWCKEVKTVQLH